MFNLFVLHWIWFSLFLVSCWTSPLDVHDHSPRFIETLSFHHMKMYNITSESNASSPLSHSVLHHHHLDRLSSYISPAQLPATSAHFHPRRLNRLGQGRVQPLLQQCKKKVPEINGFVDRGFADKPQISRGS